MNESLPSGYKMVTYIENGVEHVGLKSIKWYQRKPNQKGLTGHWSKWGGGFKDVVQEQVEDTWRCQSCGKEHPHELPPLEYPLFTGEYIRICPLCFLDDCKSLKERRGCVTLQTQTTVVYQETYDIT